jgi:hypothetical protein
MVREIPKRAELLGLFQNLGSGATSDLGLRVMNSRYIPKNKRKNSQKFEGQ